MASSTSHQQSLTDYLEGRGASTSADIQSAFKVSQPTASRLIAAVPGQIVALGRGRSTRYAVPQPLRGAAASQPIWLIDGAGQAQRVGTLTLLAKMQVHIEADGIDELFQAALPWYLAPLRAQGFLGRLLAQKLAADAVPPNPETWNVKEMLFAALHLHDAPGSLLLGDGSLISTHAAPVVPLSGAALGATLDALSGDVARTLPAGSSAGGEQPKFLVTDEVGEHFIVKFSPPRGTPFGERWNDLLHAEALCALVLARHGHEVAQCQVVESDARTYLLSKRFDREGRLGRSHAVAIGAAHAGFVAGPYVNWAATAEALARQGRLTVQDAQRVQFLLQFGRLTGNTDMHSGNVSLFAEGAALSDIAKGRFRLAPVYDMLPMRWRPDPTTGSLDYSPFTPDDRLADAAVRLAAQEFWSALSAHPAVSVAMRVVAGEMAGRVAQF
ncbi:MAG: HipA domain-containing protein [Hylemonella sp.]|nr:HipA domain-containing protein [Hylemonella sp.]